MAPGGALDRSRCQVGGINQNYMSRAGTPYHTVLGALSSHGERVMAAPVARALRSVVIDTVEYGTASR